ncbi:MAG: precorrin-6Y C5,15-methyltransferase (decarboxylating) subunit CbiT, partial [Lachnospiraceae bacterium]
FRFYDKQELCVVILIDTKRNSPVRTYGISDELFLRGKVPMTKEEVRSISLSKLELTRNAIVYDIGAGTGSVSVECAKIAREGMVYAIEKNPEALELMQQNKYKFGINNLVIVAGTAPKKLEELPIPTHAFIGGSGGKLEEIMELLWKKNFHIRVVINAISLDTVTEIMKIIKNNPSRKCEVVQVQISKAKEIGNYQMMMGQNPVYVVTIQ